VCVDVCNIIVIWVARTSFISFAGRKEMTYVTENFLITTCLTLLCVYSLLQIR